MLSGSQGEALQPVEILGKFSNQCSVLVREKVEITYENWKQVPEALKEYVWLEMLKQFTYPEGYDKEKCRGHVMALVGKALRNFRYKLNKEYVQTGRSPCTHYNYFLPKV
jgi:hypothetical protein